MDWIIWKRCSCLYLFVVKLPTLLYTIKKQLIDKWHFKIISYLLENLLSCTSGSNSFFFKSISFESLSIGSSRSNKGQNVRFYLSSFLKKKKENIFPVSMQTTSKFIRFFLLFFFMLNVETLQGISYNQFSFFFLLFIIYSPCNASTLINSSLKHFLIALLFRTTFCLLYLLFRGYLNLLHKLLEYRVINFLYVSVDINMVYFL